MNAALPSARAGTERFARRHRPRPTLELATLVHVAVLLIMAAWWFGGNSSVARTALSAWGSLGAIITLTVIRRHGIAGVDLRPLRWLWPLALFAAVVVASAFNPTFREVHDGSDLFMVERAGASGWLGSARPDLSLRALWFFGATYLSCFNLLLTVRSRRALRILLLVAVGNAVVLAVFGTVQKLIGAKGLFFGLIASPQVHFFASFVYHNHWGSFTVLMTAIAIGLVFYFTRHSKARDVWHSPASGGLVATLLLTASVPLSSSRSCTILMTALLGGALGHWLIIVLRRHLHRGSILLPIGGAAVVALVIGVFAYQLARPVIEQRVATTVEQLAEFRAGKKPDSRLTLYRDTWNLAKEKIWFGWGMASYATVFYPRNSQRWHVDGLEAHFDNAHSDWLQSISDVGLVGTSLLALCALVPLLACQGRTRISPLVGYLFGGCVVLVLYAWVEFPFANGAVVCAWWFCFFTALQYARLSGQLTSPSPASDTVGAIAP